jgi:hypothetical protein
MYVLQKIGGFAKIGVFCKKYLEIGIIAKNWKLVGSRNNHENWIKVFRVIRFSQ